MRNDTTLRTSTSTRTALGRAARLLLLTLTLTLALGATGCMTAEPEPGLELLDASAPQYGQSYSAWGADWWTWVYSQPVTGNPVLDETGADCGSMQPDGDVFFLAGSFGGPVTRTCEVPAGKALFFPLVNIVATNALATEEYWTTAEGWAAQVDGLLGLVVELELTIDGVPYEGDLFAQRSGPEVFSMIVPETDNLIEAQGLPTPAGGVVEEAVSDGFWVMLTPPAPGTHELHFGGRVDFDPMSAEDDFIVDINYTIHVE